MTLRLETFSDLEDILARVTDYEKESGYRYTGGTFDLARMHELLERSNHPERAFASIHVAGTKGKGSVSAMASAILRTTGAAPVGLYTSPHLVHLRERVRVGGRSADEEDWLGAARAVVPHALEMNARTGGGPTFFEITTAIAFEVFRQSGCEAAAIEVGLGGRLDATNVLPRERLAASVVTEIGLDHTALLGHTLEKIAREKAAIAKPGIPLVVGAREPEAIAAIEEHARATGAPVELLGRELKVSVERVSLDGTRFSLETPRARYRSLETPLIGRHQAENAALAIAAVEHAWLGPLRESGVDPTLLEEDVRRGLPQVRWRGRFDVVRRSDAASVVVDGAHDPTSARRLVETFREVLPGIRPVLLFAIARDKEIDLIARALAPLPSEAFVVRARTKRAAEPESLRETFVEKGVSTTVCEGSSAEALARARAAAGRAGVVLATGSLYLAGEVLAALEEPVD
jgi:dihydrofolate synthase/folylpolyglutamate synthase